MRSSRRMVKLTIAGLLALFGYAVGISYVVSNLTSYGGDSSENNKHYVAVIAKSTSSNFWKEVFSGANAASTEYNLSLTLEGPGNEEDYATQDKMIERAVTKGAKVIIFSAVDYNANAKAVNKAVRRGAKVVVIDSDVNSDQVSSRISTDNYEAGKMAGEAVLASSEERLNVGIVNFDKNSANGQQREEGFRDMVSTDPRVNIVETINVISTTENSKADTIKLLKRHPEINYVATFNEWTSLGVGYAIRQLDYADRVSVVAFDNNAISVRMLETGEVDALIVQNPYAMGYLGVETAYNLIYDLPIKAIELDTQTTLVTRENMFEEECQRVLFRFDK